MKPIPLTDLHKVNRCIVKSILAALVLLTNSDVMAQGQSMVYPQIVSCFQIITTGGGNNTYQVLRGQKFQFKFGGDPSLAPEFIRIRTVDQNGTIHDNFPYFESGIRDGQFHRTVFVNGGFVVTGSVFDPATNSFVLNENIFEINESINKFVIDFLFVIDNNGIPEIEESAFRTTIELVDEEEAINFSPAGSSCYTFDAFALNIIPKIDGFCGKYSGVKLSPNSPNQGWSEQEIPGPLLDLAREIQTKAGWCDDCDQLDAPAGLPDPVKCGCKEFDIELTIEPCTYQFNGLEPLENCDPIEIKESINICCDCDKRIKTPVNN